MIGCRCASLVLLLVGVGVVGCAPEVPKQVESGFSMSEHSLAFANFALGFDASEMDAELMQRMFGDEVCLAGTSPCQLTPAARAFVKKANTSMGGGRCEGFAVMSSLFQAGKLNAVDFGGATARDLTLEDNVPLQRELAYWFSTQLVPEVSAKKTKSYMAKDVMPALADALRKDGTERFRIGLVRKKGSTISGGHALTPIAYYSDAKEKGVYWLRVYDNNNPDKERLLKIDTVKNRWEFEASENPGTASRLYYGDDSNKNPLYFAPIFNRQGQLHCFFCDPGGESLVTTSGGVEASTPAAGVRKGEFLGLALPSFTAPLDDQPAEFIIPLAGGDVNLTLSNPGDADFPGVTQGVDVQGSNFTASAFDLLVTGTDQLNVSANGASVGYVNESRTSLGLKTEVALADGGALALSAILTGGSSDVTAAVDVNSGKVSIGAGNSDGTQVTMVVTTTNAMGEQTSAQLTFTSQGDGGISADTSGWMAGAPLTGTVTNNGMTMTVTNACEDGVRSGMETDVDCGSVCADQCGLGQGCNVGGDCQSTFCHATTRRCVATSCEDGRVSGSEADVDCGGGCAPCAVGRACVQNSDCEGTSACAGNVCVPTFAVGVTVSGLPTAASVVLQNRGGDDLSVGGNGSFGFPVRVTGAYAVTVVTQPSVATCAVVNGAGTATANVEVQVTCAPTWAIGGTLTGLPASESVTLLNGAESLTLTADGTFNFSTRVAGAFSVTVQTQPAGASCVVTNGNGNATADVTNLTVTCATGFTIGGTVTGLPIGEAVTLRNNGGDDLTVMADGPFTFATGTTGYAVTVFIQPMTVRCAVTNGSGTATANVTNVAVVCAPSGALDYSFNSVGWLSVPFTAQSDFWIDGVMNSDDSMVLVGQGQTAGGSTWVVSKVRSDGTLDPAFGTGGHLTVSTGTAIESARGVYRDAMGGYVVVGTLAGAADPDLGIARITPTGLADPLFGTLGTSTHDTGQWDYFEDVAQDAMGRYVVVGRRSVTGAGPHDAVLARLNTDGTLDTTFGAGGWVFYDSGGDESGNSITIDPATGHLIAVVAVNNDTVLLRYDTAGALVTTFGTAGVVTADMSGTGGGELPYRVTMSGTNILVVGRADGPTNSEFALMQFTSAGAIDTTFGTAGRLLINRGGGEVGYSITPAPGGGWYVGGHSDSSLLVGKVSASGVLDTTFGTNGFFTDVLANSGLAYHLMVDSAQRIIAVGTIRLTGTEDLGVARLTP